MLVFPDVVKVGFGGAEEYGEGCLMVGDKPVAYYATAGASYGLPLGVQTKSEVVLFMDQETLEAFRSGADWKVGTDGEVTLVRAAAGASVDFYDPMVPFIPKNDEHPTLEGRKSVSESALTSTAYEAIVIATDHDKVDYSALCDTGIPIIDTRNVIARHGLPLDTVTKA